MPLAPMMRLRSATVDDAAFIVEMARHACAIEDWPLPDADDEDTQSLLPGSDDIVVVATDANGVNIGAVWTFRHDPPLMVDTDGHALPELTIAVAPEMRGNGVGGAARRTCGPLRDHARRAHPERSPTESGGTFVPAQGLSSDGAGPRHARHRDAQGPDVKVGG